MKSKENTKIYGIYSTVAGCYAFGKAYEIFMPLHILPKSVDLPIRYHLASVTGAATINLMANNYFNDIYPPCKKYSSKKNIALAFATSAGIYEFENFQAHLPRRSFDGGDAYGGISAILLSAVLLHKLSRKAQGLPFLALKK